VSNPEYLFDGPEGAEWMLILAHGAGQGMDSDFMSYIAAGVADHGAGLGGIRLVRFEFPYMRKIRQSGRRRAPDRSEVLLQSWRRVISEFAPERESRDRLLIGGKSLGGRMASMVAEECGVGGVVCLGYPFHPPGKPDRLRVDHLRSMTTPSLICQGERDTFGNRDEVPDYELPSSIRMQWLGDGDHSFKPRKRSGLNSEANWRQAALAIVAFVGELS